MQIMPVRIFGYKLQNSCQNNIYFGAKASDNSFGNDKFEKRKDDNQSFFPPPKMPKYETLKEGSVYENWLNGTFDEQKLFEFVKNNPDKISDYDYKLFAINGVKLSEFDNDKVLEKRKIAKTDNLASFANPDITEKILRIETEKMKQISEGRKMVVVYGLSGAGKNTFIERCHLHKTHYLADVDIIKEDYKSILGDSEYAKHDFHAQAKQILQEKILKEAFEQGKNIVLPTTGLFEYMERISELCKKYNYNFDIIFVETDVDKSISRGLKRLESEDIFADPVFVYKRNKENGNLLNEIKQLDYWNMLCVFNNDEENTDIMPLKKIVKNKKERQTTKDAN